MTLSLCVACFCFGMALSSFIKGDGFVGLLQTTCAALNIAVYFLVKG